MSECGKTMRRQFENSTAQLTDEIILQLFVRYCCLCPEYSPDIDEFFVKIIWDQRIFELEWRILMRLGWGTKQKIRWACEKKVINQTRIWSIVPSILTDNYAQNSVSLRKDSVSTQNGTRIGQQTGRPKYGNTNMNSKRFSKSIQKYNSFFGE